MRADFATRTIDTVAWANVPGPLPYTMDVTDDGVMKIGIVVNPFPLSDEWALLADGSIAVVRTHD